MDSIKPPSPPKWTSIAYKMTNRTKCTATSTMPATSTMATVAPYITVISLSSLIKSFLYYLAMNCILCTTPVNLAFSKNSHGHHGNNQNSTSSTSDNVTYEYSYRNGSSSSSSSSSSNNSSSSKLGSSDGSNSFNWDHGIDLNEDFRILWTIINQDITFEIQARTLGYVGLGFSPDGTIFGTDIAIGWVDKGQTYFQDRFIEQHGDGVPIVDPSQDYALILGYENSTHTVLRFRRKLDTCDTQHDVPITNSTMRLVYMYHPQDPPHGFGHDGTTTLPNPTIALRPYRAVILIQKPQTTIPFNAEMRILELRNEDAELPNDENSVYWCKMFKLDDINRKHHLVKYEPIYDSPSSVSYLQNIILYECDDTSLDLEEMSRGQGHACSGVPEACNVIVASWLRGSKGFTYPDEAAFPIETRRARYYLMETHYNNLQSPPSQSAHSQQMADNSGLRIYFTHKLRKHDAGVLSIGMDPNWRHIIPPGQKHVISEGQCIEDCTGYAFPSKGINIFSVLMRTHQIAKQVTLRQIRRNEELYPIAQDDNIDAAYQDYRHLSSPVRVLPGDRLVAECIYDSSSRKAITLGGLTMKEESCIILAFYYPRQKKLTTCHSLPSLPTVIHSLGIEQLATNSNPVLISAPPELAGMTLEIRLLSYDWYNQFHKFQDATRAGSFKSLCRGSKNNVIPGSEFLEGYSINITKTYKKSMKCKPKLLTTEQSSLEVNLPELGELGHNTLIEDIACSSRSSSSDQELSGAHRKTQIISLILMTFCVMLQQ